MKRHPLTSIGILSKFPLPSTDGLPMKKILTKREYEYGRGILGTRQVGNDLIETLENMSLITCIDTNPDGKPTKKNTYFWKLTKLGEAFLKLHKEYYTITPDML